MAGRNRKMCTVLLSVLLAAGCGAGEPQTADVQDTEVSGTELVEQAEENTQTMEDEEGGSSLIFAEISSEMYQYVDASDGNDHRGYEFRLGHPGGGAVVFVSEESYCIFDTASGTYGFLSDCGEIIAPFGYEEAYPFHEGMACVRVDGRFGYIGMDGETVLPFIYDRAAPFSEGLAYFAIGDTYGFMDGSGEPVFYLDCESVSSFQEGRAYIFKDGKYGYIDRTGDIVIEPAYDDATYFQGGIAIVRVGGCYGAIGPDGEEILPPVYEDVPVMDGAFLYEKTGERYECYDREGNRILEGNYERVWSGEGYLFFEDESGKTGMVDEKGDMIFEPVYDHINKVPEYELAVVGDDDGDRIIDFSGETVVGSVYDSIWGRDATGGRIKVQQNGKYGVIDTTGALVAEIKYDDVRLYEDGVMLLKKSGGWEVWNADGEQILSDYDVIRRVGDCYEFETDQDGKSCYGFADLEGQIVLQPNYTGIGVYAPDYDELPLIYGTDQVVLLYGDGNLLNDGMARVGSLEELDLSAVILVNEITPGSTFYTCANADTVYAENFYGDIRQVDVQSLDAHRTRRRLYGTDGGETLLYLSMESYDWLLPTNYYALSGENTVEEETVSVYESGTGGGYESGLWYDEKEQKLVQGRAWHYGGSGNVYGREFLEEQDGNLVVSNSLGYAYDRYEGTTKYTVNGEEVTEEEYEAMRARYRWITLLD